MRRNSLAASEEDTYLASEESVLINNLNSAVVESDDLTILSEDNGG